jgi:hypothetical protein
VRRAGLRRQSAALTPGQRRRRRRLDQIRLNSATRRYTAFLCCEGLAALSPAAAARLYISSVLPLKISNRRRQSETHIGTALTTGSLHRADGLGTGCTVHMPEGAPTARRLHQRCTRVHGRSAADAGMVQIKGS